MNTPNPECVQGVGFHVSNPSLFFFMKTNPIPIPSLCDVASVKTATNLILKAPHLLHRSTRSSLLGVLLQVESHSILN
jgi:hypothetical protein